EQGHVKADEGAQLLEALEERPERGRGSTRQQTLRIRVSDISNHRQKINVVIPVSLIDIGMKLGARLFPHGGGPTIEAIRRTIDSGITDLLFEISKFDEDVCLVIVIV